MNKFDALYVINKSAKKYKKVKNNKTRSKALYRLKHTLINEWITEFDRIEEHIINEKSYYCVFKNNQAFHIPKNKLYSDPSISDKKELTNFSSTPTNEVGLTEKQCLTYINSEFNISPNRFINTNNQESIWGYLP